MCADRKRCGMIWTYEYGKITSCEFVGGCSGNTQGICMLVKGMDAKDAVDRLKGIDCRGRGTSCPDQLSKALVEALKLI